MGSFADVQATRALKMAKSNSHQLTPFAYNIDIGLRRWRASLAKLDAGWTGILNLNVLGDSITEGARAGGGSSGVVSSWITNGYVGRIRAALKAKYGDVGTGFIPPYYPYGSPLWAFSGTGWSTTSTDFGATGVYYKSTAQGGTATLTFTGTGINIITAQGANAGSFTVSIDGGAATPFNDNNGNFKPCVIHSITGLTNGTHTMTITDTSTGANTVYLQGAYPTVGSTGVQVNMVGRYGSSVYNSYDLSASYHKQYIEIDLWQPALTIISFTANDFSNQTPLATYKLQLQALITGALQYGDVLLFADGIRGDVTNPPIPQSAYVQTLHDLAIQNNCAFIDLFNRWNGDPNYVKNTLGFYTTADTVHPNDYGHQDMATTILSNILETKF